MDNETSQMLSKICDTGCFETDGNHTIAVPQQVMQSHILSKL